MQICEITSRCDNGFAKAFYTAMQAMLLESNLDVYRLVAFTNDGASTMTCSKTGAVA